MEYAVWIAFIVAMLFIEAYTTNLVSIWFAVGALGAVLAKVLGLSLIVQLCVFVVVSGASLAIAWPFIKKYRSAKKEATNADALIEKTGIVTEEITSDKFAGKVKIAGQEWSAVSSDGSDIGCGEKIKVLQISGVKLVVKKEEKIN